jgi:hypothetical protein
MCPHGGIVTHVPGTFTNYRIAGRAPMLFRDTYLVTGCPLYAGDSSPCTSIQWATASSMLIIRGSPALTQASIGLCRSIAGIPQGPVIIASCQLLVQEPGKLTVIDQ